MTDRPNILVPVRVLEGESIPEGIPDLLANAHVVLLGYHVVPDQTATDQARSQFEERANDRLDQFESMFLDAGATVERRLVFTHEAQATIDRTIYEHNCLAVLVPKATGPPEQVLVAVRGTVGVDRLIRLVSGLFADSDVDLTLCHVREEDETVEDAQTLLDAIADRLVEDGVTATAIERRVSTEPDPVEAIVESSEDFDAVVMGESDPSVVSFVFGLHSQQVADRFLGPVLVLQRERPDEEVDDDSQGS
ncbi:universal stress protein [Halanaeroarchaeum sulfurireducens]|uniref:UspA domain-containing protein n=1 Tax=Halanaeroarchaeum sulfurireducens TaxID=1604004 RepID=A0A0F7PDM7_9EURY|nr:universal stress protein [Halanaeroarchaeum sulfurireducens]AKH98300.1 UspA domain-containing protein [Halanaeroarchaeum sulfurireducens]ALG82694.1 UspA domain-containing protein [Halanaeroarchaeum sulfurireducens]